MYSEEFPALFYRSEQRGRMKPAGPHAYSPQRLPFRRKRQLTGVAVTLALLVLAGLAAMRGRGVDAQVEPLPELSQGELAALDEQQVQRVCSHCHAFPQPDALPRAAWKSVIWQMFEVSRYGSTVSWPARPQALVAWYEARAPQDWPTRTSDAARLSDLPATRHSVAAATELPPVVSFIEVAQLNANEEPQVVLCDMFNSEVLLSTGSNAQLDFQVIARLPHPAQGRVVDLDSDGRQDIVLASLGSPLALDHNLGSVQWLRQTAEAQFEPVTLLEHVGRVADVAAADLDRDGDLDLAVAEFGWRSTGHLHLLLNSAPPGATPKFESRILDGLPGASHVAISDLDQNGLSDLIVLYSQGQERVRCYLQQPGFAFTLSELHVAPSPAWGYTSMQLVDLDQDQDLDLLLTNGDTYDNQILKPYHGVAWLENQGELQFTHHVLASLPGAYCARAGDLDADGDLDVVASASAAVQPDQDAGLPTSLLLLEQVAPRQFEPRSFAAGALQYPVLALGHLDGDQRLDVLAGRGRFNFSEILSSYEYLDVWRSRAPSEPSAASSSSSHASPER